MGLGSIVRSAVATVNRVTGGTQVNVSLEAWTDAGSYAAPVYADAVTIPALWERKQRRIHTASGEEVMSRSVVTILQRVAANGATGRQEPIDPRDRITLPDGTTGPILDVQGLVDADTNAPYFCQVFLG